MNRHLGLPGRELTCVPAPGGLLCGAAGAAPAAGSGLPGTQAAGFASCHGLASSLLQGADFDADSGLAGK
jgi:hypothetical protein